MLVDKVMAELVSQSESRSPASGNIFSIEITMDEEASVFDFKHPIERVLVMIIEEVDVLLSNYRFGINGRSNTMNLDDSFSKFREFPLAVF